MVTISRQCRSWHVARAKLGVLWTTPKTLYLNNRATAGPIVLRLGIQLGTQQTSHVCGSFLGCFSTCARAHRVSVSQERLGRLCSNLVYGLGLINYMLSTSRGWSITARAHVHAAILYLRNGSADCFQIWYVGRGPLTTCFP